MEEKKTKKTTPKNMESAKKLFVNKNFNVFKALWKSATEPMSYYTEESDKLKDPKNTAVYVGVIAVASSIFTLLIKLISVLLKGKECVLGYCVETPLDARMAQVDWWTLTWQNFLYPILIVLALASIFYLGALVIKKKLDYVKLIGLSATAMLPYLVTSVVIAPILGSLWIQLGLIITMTALLYAFTLFVFFIKYEINYKEKTDLLMYYFLGCFAAISTVVYLVINQMFKAIL